jgi:hypothetical protein
MIRHLSTRSYIGIAGAVLLTALVALGATIAVHHRPHPITVPESTAIHVTLNDAVASDENRPGDHFEATVSEPVVVDGKTVIPDGAQVTGLVVDARHSGRLMGRARLQLSLESVDANGTDYQVSTASNVRVGGKHKNRNLAIIGGGAGGGLLIGAIAGGGKGALIGGPVGAAAGTAVAFATGKKDIRLPAETPLTFRLDHPVTIDVKS